MEMISVVITGKRDVSCFGSYLINIFLKSRKAERERERERERGREREREREREKICSSRAIIVCLLLFKIYIYNNDIDMKK